eukprot:4865548-Prymnesium_polylepis.1
MRACSGLSSRCCWPAARARARTTSGTSRGGAAHRRGEGNRRVGAGHLRPPYGRGRARAVTFCSRCSAATK